jgi:hypothetical protein
MTTREQRQAEAIAKATTDAADRARRAPGLAEARRSLNDQLHGARFLQRQTTDDIVQGAEDAATGQGLDQGSKGAGGSGRRPEEPLDMNARLRGRLASSKDFQKQEEDR